MSSGEKRGVARIAVTRAVVIRTGDGQRLSAKLSNLSVEGAGIMSSSVLTVGMTAMLNFELLIYKKLVAFGIKGVVTHAHLRSDSYYLGVSFRDLSEETRRDLAMFVKFKGDQRSA